MYKHYFLFTFNSGGSFCVLVPSFCLEYHGGVCSPYVVMDGKYYNSLSTITYPEKMLKCFDRLNEYSPLEKRHV